MSWECSAPKKDRCYFCGEEGQRVESSALFCGAAELAKPASLATMVLRLALGCLLSALRSSGSATWLPFRDGDGLSSADGVDHDVPFVAPFFNTQEGHMSRACPKAKSPSACFHCGQEGHLSRACPTAKGGLTCFNCGGSGHLARDCTEARKAR